MANTYTKEQIQVLSEIIRTQSDKLGRPNMVKLVLERSLSDKFVVECDLVSSIKSINTSRIFGASEYKNSLLELLEKEVDDMPRYLSSDDPDIRILSEWRLTIGR